MADENLGVPFNPITGVEVTNDNQTVPVVEVPNVPAEPVVNPPAGGEPQKEPEKVFDIEFFNKFYNTEFKSPDDIKPILESTAKVKEYESKIKDLEKVQGEFSELSKKYEMYKKYEDGFDPLSLFASPEDYKLQQFKRENPDKDISVAYEVFTSDFKGVSDLDVLVKYEKFNDPGLDSKDAEDMVASKYGIDPDNLKDPSSWTTVVKNQVRRDATAARKEFDQIKQSVKLPEKVDVNKLEAERQAQLNAKRQELSESWSYVVDEMVKDMGEIPVFDVPNKEGKSDKLVSFILDDNMKSDIKQSLLTYLTENGLDVTKENVEQAGIVAQSRVILQNLPTILKTYGNSLLSAQEKAHNQEIHNPNRVNIEPRPGAEEEAEKERSVALSDPIPSVRRPMFKLK